MTTTDTDRGAAPAELALAVPTTAAALPDVRATLDRWLTGLGVDTGTRQDVVLVVDEALTNAIEHAYGDSPDPGPISLTAVHDAGGVEVRVRDQGTWKQPTVDGVRGRGLAMIAAIADRMDLSVADGHTTVFAHVPHRD